MFCSKSLYDPYTSPNKFSVKDQFTLEVKLVCASCGIRFIYSRNEGAYKELVLSASGASHNLIQAVCKVPSLTNKNNLTGHE